MASPVKVYPAVLEVKLTAAQADGLKDCAAIDGVSVSELVRAAIDAFLSGAVR